MKAVETNNHLLMAFYRFPLLKVHPAGYGAVIRVSFFDVSMTSGKMRRYETKTCIMIVHAYSNGPFVPGNASQSSLTRNMMNHTIRIRMDIPSLKFLLRFWSLPSALTWRGSSGPFRRATRHWIGISHSMYQLPVHFSEGHNHASFWDDVQGSLKFCFPKPVWIAN